MSDWLRAHPDVWIPPEKELSFFDRDDRADDLGWYRACFAPAGDQAAVGEATPTYMTRADVLDRIAARLPEVRLIAMLRDPVDRAYSHYWHWHERKGEQRSFAEVVGYELDNRRTGDVGRWDPEHPERYSYLAHGHYGRQLDWLAQRFPPDALHVVLFDDLRSDPAETFRAVCRFLSVDDGAVPESVGSVANPYLYYHPAWLWSLFVRVRIGRWLPARAGAALWRAMVREGDGYPPMDGEVRARLGRYYRPECEALGQRLGRDLSGWAAPQREPAAR